MQLFKTVTGQPACQICCRGELHSAGLEIKKIVRSPCGD